MTPKAVDMPHKFNRYMIIDSETGEILDDTHRRKQKQIVVKTLPVTNNF